ncbi:MAG: hypothetical protein NVS1B4_11610 [Gemmatimonadaceae bacterium]
MPFLLFMPSYNHAHYIRQAVDSILLQDDPDWELWIVDNSTDNTPTVMARYTDPRIKFHHMPQRMDPGSCLNWMLERAEGRDFSYVHTDNNLHAGYVRCFRAALAGDPLSLAYCDMRVIDGRRVGVFRRGSFDLSRVVSLSPLGVPFAATTQLARQLGGFSQDDAADDVLFCTRAYGLGRWTYVREPLVDYRVHASSRTEECGGPSKLEKVFLRTFAGVIPELEARGLDPKKAMVLSLRAMVDDFRMIAEDHALRLKPPGIAWWGGEDYLDGLWKEGLVTLPWFNRGDGGPRKMSIFGTLGGKRYSPRALRRLRRQMRPVNVFIGSRAERFRTMLLGYASLRCGCEGVTLRAGSSDVMTLWACRILSRELGWTIELSRPAPAWIRWREGTGPVTAWIDLSGRGQAPEGIPALVW